MRDVAEAAPTPHAALVLVILATYADERGRARPSVAELSRKSHLSRRAVLRILAEQEREGRIVKVEDGRGRGRATVWRVPVPDMEKVPLAAPFITVKGATGGPEKVPEAPVKGATGGTSRGKAEEINPKGSALVEGLAHRRTLSSSMRPAPLGITCKLAGERCEECAESRPRGVTRWGHGTWANF